MTGAADRDYRWPLAELSPALLAALLLAITLTAVDTDGVLVIRGDTTTLRVLHLPADTEAVAA